MPSVIIDVRKLNFSFDKKHPVLNDIDLPVHEHDYLVIMGPNGGGKTTLLKCMLGLLKPDSGSVDYRGISTLDVGYVPQFTTFDKHLPIRVREFIETGLINRYHPLKSRRMDPEPVEHQIQRFSLSAVAHASIGGISGGELQRVLLARALVRDPKVLFLDEPTTFIDPESRGNLSSLLKELNKTTAIVMITHDTSAIDDHVKNIACINRKLYYHGREERIQDSLEKVYGCPIELIGHGLPHRVLKEHK
ncbi:MAG: metal ABC transporter ATP-binding protein [FCB group bacterium]|nr:metal ABC transporter ATP-binding protein [FCB group bacterium]